MVACNALVGIEPGVLGLCADGTRVEDTGCESDGGSNGVAACTAPWQRRDPVGGRCYLQEYVKREWASAEQRCVDLGGHLVAIDSANELALLADWIASEVWIGGSDAKIEGTFAWTNGQAWTFTSWKEGLPVDPGGTRDCVVLTTSPGSLPVSECRLCSEKLGYVCENAPDDR